MIFELRDGIVHILNEEDKPHNRMALAQVAWTVAIAAKYGHDCPNKMYHRRNKPEGTQCAGCVDANEQKRLACWDHAYKTYVLGV